MPSASFHPSEFTVRHTVREDVGREFVSFDIPNGWDDVKKVTKKVLVFEGRKFRFSCWNSDRNECIFFRMLDGEISVASFSK